MPGIPTVEEASAVPIDPTEMLDGTERVLLFRALGDGLHRSTGGLVGIFYRGPLVESMSSLERHALAAYGPGRYRIVVQRMVDGCWSYVTSTVMAIAAMNDPEDDDRPRIGSRARTISRDPD